MCVDNSANPTAHFIVTAFSNIPMKKKLDEAFWQIQKGGREISNSHNKKNATVAFRLKIFSSQLLTSTRIFILLPFSQLKGRWPASFFIYSQSLTKFNIHRAFADQDLYEECLVGQSAVTTNCKTNRWQMATETQQNAISGEGCWVFCLGGWCVHLEWCFKFAHALN